MRASKGYYPERAIAKGVCHCHLHFGRHSKADRGVGNFTVEKGFSSALTGGYGMGSCRGGFELFTEMGHPV